MHVVQYALQPDPAAPLEPPAPDAVSSLNTHDMPPFSAWLQGLDIGDRKDLGLLSDAQAEWDRGVRGAQRRALLALLRREGLPAEDAVDSLLFYTLVHLHRRPGRECAGDLEHVLAGTGQHHVARDLHVTGVKTIDARRSQRATGIEATGGVEDRATWTQRERLVGDQRVVRSLGRHRVAGMP